MPRGGSSSTLVPPRQGRTRRRGTTGWRPHDGDTTAAKITATRRAVLGRVLRPAAVGAVALAAYDAGDIAAFNNLDQLSTRLVNFRNASC